MPVVYISPSTQENNIGVGNYGTEERRMNQIADIVVPMLKYNNFTVYRNRPEMTLRQVVEDSNRRNVDAHIAIHSNAGGGRGGEVFYTSSSGKVLAADIYKYIVPLTPTSDRGIKPTDGLYEVTRTRAVAALIEIAFHDNREDAVFILNNMSAIAEAIVKGICDYFNVPFRKAQTESPPDNNSGKLYKVQAGAFAEKENADKLAEQLKKDGYNVYIYKEDLFKVQVGAFREQENAEKLAAGLKAKGYVAYIYQE
jgi:N-acetylmuramoyl-L-alanine amidase